MAETGARGGGGGAGSSALQRHEKESLLGAALREKLTKMAREKSKE
jgi:hypothetical protein